MFISLLRVALLAIMFFLSSFPSTSASSQEGRTVNQSRNMMIDRSQAIRLAKQYLRSQPFKDKYLLNSAEAHDNKTFWEVWFRRRKPSRPAHGIVRVDKETGRASWQPSR